MSERNEQFARHTRSATFALTLSDGQIQTLLAHRKTMELRAKYPWHEPGQVNFGDGFVVFPSQSERALCRKGLMEVVEPLTPPYLHSDQVRPTRAGDLMTDLLAEAGFVVDPTRMERVRRHSDDRKQLVIDGPSPDAGTPRYDRRDPSDLPFLDGVFPENTVWEPKPTLAERGVS